MSAKRKESKVASKRKHPTIAAEEEQQSEPVIKQPNLRKRLIIEHW